MRKPIIVCFTGIDGSGKTSHAHALIKELAKRGIHCKYVWCRWSFGLASVFHFIIRKTFGYTKEKYTGLIPLQIIFKYLIFLDLTISIFLKVRIPRILRYCVVIDRYIYDLFADLIFWGFDFSSADFFVKLMFTMNPKPNIIFLMYIPLQVALPRKDELSLDEAQKYQKIYDDLADIHNFRKIFNLNFREVHNRILETVMQVLAQ